VRPEQAYKTLDKGYTFRAVGVAPFGQHGKEQGKGDPLIYHAQHEDVDVRPPELPVGAIDCQLHLVAFGQKREHQLCHQIRVERETGHETLDAPEGGIGGSGMVEGIGQLVEGNGTHLAERAYEKRDQLYPCQI